MKWRNQHSDHDVGRFEEFAKLLLHDTYLN